MKQYPNIIERVYHNPWYITVGSFDSIHQVLKSRLWPEAQNQSYQITTNGVGTVTYGPDVVDFDWGGTNIAASIDEQRIGHVPIRGILGHRISGIERMSGGTDYLEVEKTVQGLLDKGATGMMFEFDSNGGMTRGCQELAQFIRNLPVPTHAFTDSKMNSAAYYLASACAGITATESSDIGSIGVILPWIDQSKLWETTGIKFDPIINDGAIFKGTGGGPTLDGDQRKQLQKQVNFAGKQFKDFVESSRPKVNKEVFKAGTYFGPQALEMGLIDAIGSHAQATEKLLTRIKNNSNNSNHNLKPRLPEPIRSGSGKKRMTKDELRAQFPDLYNEMVQEQEQNTISAIEIARAQEREKERTRIAALDALSFSAECQPIIEEAKRAGKQPQEVALSLCQILGEENGKLRTKLGVYSDRKQVSEIASDNGDPTRGGTGDSRKDLSKRLTQYAAQRYHKELN